MRWKCSRVDASVREFSVDGLNLAIFAVRSLVKMSILTKVPALSVWECSLEPLQPASTVAGGLVVTILLRGGV